jgi:hypothetical protein
MIIYYKRKQDNDPYMPSASEKKRNKEDKFMYDPEDTSYLNTPYGEDGNGNGRYEMQGNMGKSDAAAGRNAQGAPQWPLKGGDGR